MQLKVVAVLGTSIFLLTGCNLPGTQKVDLRYTADPEANSPLSTIRPLTVTLQVVDRRDPQLADMLATRRATIGVPLGKIVSKRNVPDVLFDALRKEFEDNQHRLVSSDEATATQVKVELRRCWAEARFGIFHAEMLARLECIVTVRGGASVRPAMNRVFRSVARGSGLIVNGQVGPVAFEKVLNAALEKWVVSLTHDPDFLKALEIAPSLQ